MQAQPTNNVTILNQGTVYKHIESFLRNKKKRSENTYTEYKRDIEQFFMIVKNRKLEQLEPSDLELSLSNVLDYQTFLAEEFRDKQGMPYKNTTVNRKVNVIRSLYNFFAAQEYKVNPVIFTQVKDLPSDVRHIGYLDADEARLLAHLAESTEKHMGKEKKALILLAACTSVRKDAINHLRYEHLRKSEVDDNMYLIEAPELFDKGKQIDKEIHVELYNLLMEIKGDKEETDTIFNFSNMAISRMMSRLCDKGGIDPKRHCSFHSLKKAGIVYVRDATGGDLHAAQMQAGHRNFNTTSKSYIPKTRNLAGMLFFEKLDDQVYDDMSKEELLQLVKGIKSGFGIHLKREAKKIKDTRK